MIQFAYPQLWVLMVLPVLMYYLLPPLEGIHGDALRIPFLKDLKKIKSQNKALWQFSLQGKRTSLTMPLIVLFAIYSLLVVAVCRPQQVGEPVKIPQIGRDIILVMDISTSMLERDFIYQGRRLSRLQAVKLAAADFIDKRRDDRIGLILFGTRAYLQSPLTYDKAAVKNILFSMEAGMAGNSTAIGDALGLALKSLKDNKDKNNKIIILLTDGENNDGSVSMPQAINLAQNEKVKIYTIGVGGAGSLMQSILSYKIALPSGIDEAGLQTLAEEAGGKYFRADDTAGLVKIYEAINQLEPQNQEDSYVQEIKEYYYIPVIAAFLLAMALMFLKWKGR